MLSIDDYESLMETLYILADPKAMAGLKAGEADAKKGKTRTWDEVRRSIAKSRTSTKRSTHGAG